MWKTWILFSLLVFVTAGCRSNRPNLKPPQEPENYVLPPNNDPRYNKHIEFPKDTLHRNDAPKPAPNMGGPMPGGNMGMRPGGGSGLR